jgi:hypothetical protein
VCLTSKIKNLRVPWVFAFFRFLLEDWPAGCCSGPRPAEATRKAKPEGKSADFDWKKIEQKNDIRLIKKWNGVLKIEYVYNKYWKNTFSGFRNGQNPTKIDSIAHLLSRTDLSWSMCYLLSFLNCIPFKQRFMIRSQRSFITTMW